MEKENKNAEIKKIKLSTVLYSVAFFVILLIIGLAIFVYKFSNDNLIANKVGKNLPFPAIVINGRELISIGEINSNLQSIKRFYENQDFSSLGYRVDFSTEDGKKRLKLRERELINKMIEDRAIEYLAKEKNIKITSKAVDEAVDRKLSEFGNKKDITENLKKLYGWSLKDFKNKIVKPSLNKERLSDWVEENAGKQKNARAEKNIMEAKRRLDNGDAFNEIANDMNKQQSSGGYMGWFEKEYLVSELQKVIASMQKGDVSDIVKSKLGYHILKLNDKKNKDGKELYSLSQIFFPRLTFADWLDEKIKKMKVTVLLSDYFWEKKKGFVEFKNNEMQEFEKKALNSSQRDVSLITL